MRRYAIDRWADTTLFRLALLLAAVAVLPVLFMGFITTFVVGAAMLAGRIPAEFGSEQAAFLLLSVGGVLGFVGYQRAHWGVKDPCRHNVATTLVFLAAGVLAALSVAGVALATAIEGRLLDRWGSGVWLSLGALFASANLVWAFAGIAWMQRLMRRYEEKAGRAFDGLPVVLLFTAIALVIAATLKTITL